MSRRSEGARPWQRNDGRWETQYIDATGKRRSVYARTKRDVKRKLRDRLEERDQGVGGEATTVGGWLEAWLSREKKRLTTMASRRYLVGLLPRWFLKIRMIDESLSPAHVARMLDEGGTKNRRRRRFVLTATAVGQSYVQKHRLAEERRTLGDAWTVKRPRRRTSDT